MDADVIDVDAVVLDLDGVIYNGALPIPRSSEAVSMMKDAGIKIFFLTNSAGKSRMQRARYLAERFDIDTDAEHVYTSSYAAAKYVHEHFDNPFVYYIGGPGIGEELFNFGIPVVEHFYANVVIAGIDKHATYYKLDRAVQSIRDGAAFIATNPDAGFISTNGFYRSGAGAIVSFIQKASEKEPTIVGKPNPYLLNYIISEHNLDKDKIVIVGDNLYSDIKMGNIAGITTVLVQSGLHKEEHINGSNTPKPDYVCKDLYSFVNDLILRS